MKMRFNLRMKTNLIRGALYLLLPLAACAIPLALGQWQTHAASSKNNPVVVCNEQWQMGADMPSTGVHMVGVWFWANGRFYAMGGRSMDGLGNDFTHPFEYDPASDTWTIKSATFPDNQVGDMACAVLSDSGKPYIYCVGGSAGGQTTATNRIFRYNPVTDAIDTIASPWPGNSDGITLPGGFAEFENKLYILGGFRINTEMTDTIWEFTPGTNTWTQKAATLPTPRGYIPTVASYPFIYTAGGSAWNGSTLVDTNDSFEYDPRADSIITIPNMPRATSETGACWFTYGGGGVWVMSGGETPPNPSNEVDIYAPGANEWMVGTPLLMARRSAAIGTDSARCLFCTSHIWVAGGYASDGTPLSSMETFCYTVPTPSEPPHLTPTPTPTATATSTVTPPPTPSPTSTGTPTRRPTPRPRPSLPPRP